MFPPSFTKKVSLFLSFSLAILALTTTVFTSYIPVFTQSDVPEFTPDYVLDDVSFRSTRAFPTQQSIQDYLNQVNSPIKNYRQNNKLASQIIFEAARGITSSQYGYTPQINPGVIMAYIEKEMGLISNSNYDVINDKEGRVQKAMGYGCPDIGGCDPDYRGFSNQINWGSLQLEINYVTANPSSPKKIQPYVTGSKMTTLDGYTFVISNQATAACYRYTPHVFYGCYNLWKIVTANGWGISSQKYTYDDLDKVSLKKKSTSAVVVETISETDGQKLIWQDFDLGQNDLNVRNLQRYLKQNNYFNGQNISSIYDRSTGDSLRKFIMDKNLIKNDVQITSTCKNLINQNYIFGSENGNVKQLQRCLIEQKVFDVYNNTGYYGEITIKAHKFIQAIIQKEDILKNVSGKGNSVDSVVIVADKSDNCEVIGRNFIIGQMGDSVTKLQECLKSKGVYKWSNGVTGYFGEYTNSLYRDVIQNLPCKEVKSQKWEYGERSFRVSRLQECLREDGKFDYSTITGFLGPITWRGLKS